jgi:mannose-6-phosphate isomerase-like protein (cupin superfamily)
MRIMDHARQEREEWRPGVLTQMQVSAVTGSVQLCVFQQWCDPGKGAPTHLHAVEEVLTVLEGEAEFWLEDERMKVTAGQSMIVPAGRKHGFRNIGKGTLHTQAILASPIFEAAFDDKTETPRRYVPARS